ncbi:phosphoglucomutase/phosphomannomutase PgmG [Caenispirillum salinarum]|uniref:phosphoglucomutase/phosphomannomutase PgmG n=1 Tax=Caenispirillum salinarum TaxID=859058 RepID=UPI00384F79CF
MTVTSSGAIPAHHFHPSILRAYDIRGIVGETLSAADARAIGCAFGSIVRRDGGRSVAVGRDGRLSSPELEAALVEGLTAVGCTVTRIGCGPTPMLYYACAELATDGGVMVTGSHNPPTHNGFKMVKSGKPFYGDAITGLGEIASAGAWAEGAGAGAVEERDLRDAYTERLLCDHGRNIRPLTVVWDAGNGATGDIMSRLTDRLPGRHILLNAEIDGTFPAHHPDPTLPETLEQLRAAVAEEGADVGIAFDGDGDRIGVIDGRGAILWGDQLLMLLAEEVLARHPGAPIIADVKASKTLFDHVAALGGEPVMWRTGHSLIKTKMRETGAPLAGEMSGHIFFADGWYGFDDGLYAAVRLLDLVGRVWSEGTTLAERHAALPRLHATPEIRIDCPEEHKFDAVRAVTEAVTVDPQAQVSTVDGVRVTTPDGWWLLRASNTQAALVARCEGEDKAALGRLVAGLARTLDGQGLRLSEDIRRLVAEG